MYLHKQDRPSLASALFTDRGNSALAKRTQIVDRPMNTCPNLQLLLFVDRRPHSRDKINPIKKFLHELNTGVNFDLQVIDVSEKPYLAEHFKLLATPTLIKLGPGQQQMIAGTNILEELAYWWPRWQTMAQEFWDDQNFHSELGNQEINTSTLAITSEMIQMSDEIFRLKQENQQMAEQLQFKDRILRMLAHDLRNPLTAASLALETLAIKDLDNLPLAPHLKKHFLQQAQKQIKSIERMICDILDSSTGNHHQIKMQLEKLDIGILCIEMIKQMLPNAEAKNQTIDFDIPGDLPLVYADPERIKQVLVNLLDNAIKYTPNAGHIRIIALHRTSQKVQVSICDSGLGIPEEKQSLIFQERFRLARDEVQTGYGIGLFLCQRIIRAHYGQIWVDSIPNKGSTFHFTLPVY